MRDWQRRAIYWILNGRVPEPCTDIVRWGTWFQQEHKQRIVGKTELMGGDIVVSTVFLGIDHQFLDGPPILFETMVFGEEHLTKIFGRERMVRDDLLMWRYSTYEQAERGHALAVRKMERRIKRAQAMTTRAMTMKKVEQ